ATDESINRLQNAMNYAMPYALGMFEPSPVESVIISSGLFRGENLLREMWQKRIATILDETQLKVPDMSSIQPQLGGRLGNHTEHLQPLLDEMGEVFRIDPKAEW